MAAVAGLRGTGDWATDERPKNFREFILFRNPNGTAPIFGLMAKVKKESVDDPEFNWWDEPNDLVRLTVNGALGTGDTTVVINSTDPTIGSDVPWGVARHLKAGDILLVEPAADAVAFANEYIEVVSVSSDTSFTVLRGAAGSTAAAIGNGASLLLMGSSYAEGTGAPRAASRNPIKYNNLCQIFKDTYEITGTAEQTRTRTGDPVKNDRKRKSFDHARAIELALLYGRKSETTGDNGKPKRTMDGLRRFIPASNTTVFTAAYDLNAFLDAIAKPFDWDSEAGDTRIAFTGNTGLNFLNKKIMSGSGQSALNVNMDSSATLYGMNFTKFKVPQGTLLLKTHPLLNRHPLYRNSMFILDFSCITWRPMRGRDTKMKDDVQNKDEDLRRGYWQTEAGVEVSMGGLTMAYIGGLNAT